MVNLILMWGLVGFQVMLSFIAPSYATGLFTGVTLGATLGITFLEIHNTY